jgi:hypothetical protein
MSSDCEQRFGLTASIVDEFEWRVLVCFMLLFVSFMTSGVRCTSVTPRGKQATFNSGRDGREVFVAFCPFLVHEIKLSLLKVYYDTV